MSNFLVRFLPDEKNIDATAQDSLLQAALRAGITMQGSCGGKGTCGRCRVQVLEGEVRREAGAGEPHGQAGAGRWVLACRSYPEGPLVVEVPAGSRLDEHRVVASDGGSEGFAPDKPESPLFRRVGLRLTPPSLDDAMDDVGRLRRFLRAEIDGHAELGLEILKKMPSVLRQAGWEVDLGLLGHGESLEVIDILPRGGKGRFYGLAVDVGTTTVVAELIDLETGASLGTRGTYNRQAAFGDDVISRIIYAGEHPGGLVELQGAAVETINGLIRELVLDAAVESQSIYSVVLAGNTTMLHLLLGIDPAGIRLEPYVPVTNSAPPLRAGCLGLDTSLRAPLYFLPGVAGYVGGDITAGVLVSDMARGEELTLFLDIGTNGEMVLGNREWLVTCSCSAGPAFEGGGIKYGMRAMGGAIEKITIAPGGAGIEYHTVDQLPPAGICGSGLIDLLSQLYRAGLIDRTGRFENQTGSGRIIDTGEGPGFLLAPGGESLRGEDIIITEAEIMNLIRSKGAVFAGIRTMLNMVGLPVEAIDRVIIAGGFGSYIDMDQAVSIGLLPDLPRERFKYIGNSSLKGAKMALLSRRERERAEELCGRMTYLELSAGNMFMEEYVSALFIPHTDLSLFPSQVRPG